MSDELIISIAAPHLLCLSIFFRKFQRHVQRIHELVDLDRLGEIAEEARLQAFLDIVRHGIGADGKHRDVRRCRIFTQDLQRLDAADAGQIDVHQDHLRLMDARQRDALRAIPRAQQAHIGTTGDELLDQLHVCPVVFHVQQGAQRCAMLNMRLNLAQAVRLRRRQVVVQPPGSVRSRTHCPSRPCFPRRSRLPSIRPAACSPPGRCRCLPRRRPLVRDD